MSAPNTIKVKVGNEPLTIPVYRDEETTLDIVRQVNERLAEVEAQEKSVNSLVFALKAAVMFAVELRESQDTRAGEKAEADAERKSLEGDFKAEQTEGTRQLTVVLDRIAEALQSVIDDARAVDLDS